MKKYIVMLLVWVGICLLSLPETTEQENTSNEEVASATISSPIAQIQQDFFNKLP